MKRNLQLQPRLLWLLRPQKLRLQSILRRIQPTSKPATNSLRILPNEKYLLEEYLKAVPYLTISEASDMKDKLVRQIAYSDKEIGKLERENVKLQDHLLKIESDYAEIKKM